MKIILLAIALMSCTIIGMATQFTSCIGFQCPPYVSTKAGNTIRVNCPSEAWAPCLITFKNKAGQQKSVKVSMLNASIGWAGDNISHLQSLIGSTGLTNDCFIDFTNMKVTGWIGDVFTMDVKRNIIAYAGTEGTEIRISPLFDLSKCMVIKADFTFLDVPSDVVIPGTHFDENGNFVLVYYAGKDGVEETKTIPVEYNKFRSCNTLNLESPL